MSEDFIRWDDPYAWTEHQTMKTKKAIQKENRIFKEIVGVSGGEKKTLQEHFKRAYDTYKKEILVTQSNITIKLDQVRNGKIQWKYTSGGLWTQATTVDTDSDAVAYTAETDEKYDYMLHVRLGKTAWTAPIGGGPYVAIKEGHVFFLEGDSPLHYTRLVSFPVTDSSKKRLVYEEKNPSCELTLMRLENRGLFLMRENAGYQEVAAIEEGTCKWLNKDAVAFFPVSFGPSGPIYFARFSSFDSPWRLFGAKWILNDEIKMGGIEFCSASLSILVTRTYGIRTIWRLSETKSPKKLYSGFFEILPHTRWAFWANEAQGAPLWVQDPVHGQYKIACTDKYIHLQIPKTSYAKLYTDTSSSADGIPVRWILLRKDERKKSKGLMIVSYGAYGITTSLNTVRWIPWIEAGWAIAILFVRGGGDGNEMWADIGRLSGKEMAIKDVEACCLDLQDITDCGAKQTCIFGRSAGGLIAGNLVSRNPSGKMFKCVYAEVPYVDLLKTASNPALPLTEYEYDEFGNPMKGPAQFEQTLRISPIHTLGPEGAPGVSVLCRSGIYDIEVYPYESLKWIYALRGKNFKDRTKILYVNGQSHHTYGSELYLDLAEDFSVINRWIE